MGRFKLLDLKYTLIQRWGMAFGRGFPLMSWQEGILKGERITPNAIGYFKKEKIFQNSPKWKTIGVEPTWDEKPPRPKTKSRMKPNKIFVIKGNFWEGEFFRRKNLNNLPQIKIKVWKSQINFLGVTTPTPLGKISSPRFQLILK